jgi:heme exporter protein A
MLEVSDVACIRGERTLFSGVSISLDKGTLLRVAGANGSGKTSLLRIICGLALPAEGEVRWMGRAIRSQREEYAKDLVYIGHSNAVKDDLTALENLAIGAVLSGRAIDTDTALAALSELGIAQCAALPARVLSHGQRRRVALARLVASRTAPLWLLDEPFTALDAASVTYLETLIGNQLARGGTVLLTTHQEVRIAAPRQQRIDLGAC